MGFWQNLRDEITDRSHLFENTKSLITGKSQQVTESKLEHNPNSKGDFYYLGKKIEEIKGDAVIEVLQEIPMFTRSFSEFQDPTINSGYNIILLEGPTEGVSGITANILEDYQAQDLYDKYKETGQTYPGFSAKLFESKEFENTLLQGRGLIPISLATNTISKVHNKSHKEWYWVKDYTETVAHEFIIHAMRKILRYNSTNDEDHIHYFSDTKLGLIYSGRFSANEQYLLQEAPNSPAGARILSCAVI